MRQTSSGANPTTNGGFEAKLWQTADALRNNMDAAEYKHVVLGLIFLKYISDAFEAKHAELVAELEADRAAGADPEDPDEYRAVSIFWVPREARWQHLTPAGAWLRRAAGARLRGARGPVAGSLRPLPPPAPRGTVRPGEEEFADVRRSGG